ncbi:hypothetical protein ES703_125511 [subsurface metagenome]
MPNIRNIRQSLINQPDGAIPLQLLPEKLTAEVGIVLGLRPRRVPHQPLADGERHAGFLRQCAEAVPQQMAAAALAIDPRPEQDALDNIVVLLFRNPQSALT